MGLLVPGKKHRNGRRLRSRLGDSVRGLLPASLIWSHRLKNFSPKLGLLAALGNKGKQVAFGTRLRLSLTYRRDAALFPRSLLNNLRFGF